MRRRGLGQLAALTVWMVGLVAVCLLAGPRQPARAATRNASAGCGTTEPTIPGATQSGASITLSRTRGPAGMSLAVSGQGWPTGATVVLDVDMKASDGTLYVMTSTAVQTVVATDGTFQTRTFAMPALQGCAPGAPGGPSTDVLFVARTSDGAVLVETPFSYTPQPTLESRAGQQVRTDVALMLTGVNWEPGERVTITSATLSASQALQVPAASGTLVPSATAHTTANSLGEISLTYALPDGLPPRSGVLLQATGTGPLYGTVMAQPIEFLIRPVVDPTITLDRAQGVAGARVVVRGEHWYPGDTVQIEYCRGQDTVPAPNESRCPPEASEPLDFATVDASGRFSQAVSLPTNARTGPITIQARVPNDIFGLAVYAQVAPFEIVPPPLPWDRQHPRLALALAIVQPALPALALGVTLLAAYVWSRRRARRTAAGQAAAVMSRDL